MNIPQAGELYRHFKGKLYQIIGIAIHSEDGSELVIYQALYGDFRLYARPLSMFMSPVDREKYPEAAQEYRFQKISRAQLTEDISRKDNLSPEKVPRVEIKAEEETEKTSPEQKLVEAFLDEDSALEQIAFLEAREKVLTAPVLDIMAAALDVELTGRTAEEKRYDLIRVLRTRARFEGRRMR